MLGGFGGSIISDEGDTKANSEKPLGDRFETSMIGISKVSVKRNRRRAI
jgi:hypothetical protein